MFIEKINDEDGKGHIRALVGEDVEFVDPVKHYHDSQIKFLSAVYRDMLRMKNPFMTALVPEEFFAKKAEAAWKGIYDGIMASKVPPNFIALLHSERKQDQENLMKHQSLTPDQLGALIFRAWNEFGYTMSSYFSETLQKDVNPEDMPRVVRMEDDKVVRIGESDFSDKKLKAVIAQRKVIVAKFLDHGKNWHCFFQTYKSLRGEETGRDGQPHLHYLSDKWLVPREKVVEGIRAGQYPATSVHIALNDYK